MLISIIGNASCGKTTLFQALSGIDMNGRDAGNPASITTIDVPDERLDTLTKIFKPRKTVYARIEASDTAAIREGDAKNETMNPKMLHQLRFSNAFLLVLRYFDNGYPVDPVGDYHTINTEFMLADIAQIEKRLERIACQNGKKDNTPLQQEKVLLEECLSHLNEGRPLNTLPTIKENGKALRSFQFLSEKPMMAVINYAEEKGRDMEGVLAEMKQALPGNVPVIATCAKLEAELALVTPDEQAGLMAEFGITETIRSTIIQLSSRTLGLISFLTVGEDECRAWPIQDGMSAQDAAGTIHSDFYDKFIRAETVAYDAFIEHNGFAGCKKAGLWRLEGKTYIVRDGDILTIRAGN
ncbi:MAG: Ribosome-binding ATPase YchF [Syntrophorhabdus sp. PtaU1.Bin058]|nr:MAG: Ribosome-binding ATPase YchF [Syntrophorhabdus sp. PtaU1.Bin058]